ncbi:uncharacterized protein LOC132720576 [Ruditapes philippinarum]|uniref:uncharacterized protein LOC132720576 n=1 Tax=Ruditapes philippinarum TaxID=129788 RepID=UPI00295AA8F1|nr:uncharacterized protein LOC132720576 [Ruditapes philippinarum]
MAQKPDNRANLFRLQIIIIDGGLLVLRNIIDQTLSAKGITLSACLNNEKATITRLKSRGVITQVQYDILFPTGGQAPTTSEMDFTLITCLLRCLKCFGLNKKFDWNTKPIATDLTVEADICRLKAYRNEICHVPTTTGIQPNVFVNWWNDIEQILVRRSSPPLKIHQAIADFEGCLLDPEEEKRLHEEIKRWKDYEADVDRLNEEMKKVQTDFIEVKKGVEAEFTEMKKEIEAIKERQDAVKSNEGVSSVQTVEEKYQTHKKELKDGLFEFYKTRHSKVFLSPLFEEKDTSLASFYIRPELNSIVSTQTRNDEKVPVKLLSEMFKSENIKHREIYVLAEAGLGKTAFSKYLANVWCQAHYPDENMTDFLSKDDIDCMQGFDFLFLVLLRDSDDLCSIDDLIFEKNVSFLGLEEKLPEDVLLKILKNEKCLVILDGLDEWIHPDKNCYRSPRSIPHRNDREKCTVLTTTRPWKLGVLNLNSSQIGKKVELTKLSKDSAVTIIERIVQRLKSHQNKDSLKRDVSQFIQTINWRQNDELAFVPLILIYTICLWCDGIQIGNSKCDLYINIVELLLSRTIQIHGELHQLRELSSSDIPECFAEYNNCTKYYPLLMHLGKLAYHTLFSETKENTLVFDGSVAGKYLTTDEMKSTLHSGMLSESTSKSLTKRFSKVSFSHKTVQEFFAAIFISSQSDAQKIVIEKCRNIQDILDMSIIYEFMSKMNADRMCAISNDLMSAINEDEETRDYRTRTGIKDKYSKPLYDIQKMFLSCLQEIPKRENVQLCLQDFFIEDNTVHSAQLQHLFKQNKTNIKSLYINNIKMSSSLCEIIDIFSLTDLSHVQKLFYYGDRWKEEAEIKQILFPSIQAVTLLCGIWTNVEDNLEEDLARVQNLQYLYIGCFTLSHKILETIFNFISSQNSMKELRLDWLYCKEHGYDCKGLNLNLSQHSLLSKLYLTWLPWLQLNISTPSLVDVTLLVINLDESSLLLSRDMLNIERMVLGRIEMSAGSLQNFITVLENLPQSFTVEMRDIKPKSNESIIENIRSSQNFHVRLERDINNFNARRRYYRSSQTLHARITTTGGGLCSKQ